jgi:hypothetical protein
VITAVRPARLTSIDTLPLAPTGAFLKSYSPRRAGKSHRE